jgi:nicotinate-nucleotide adenylyltransferase
MTTDASVLQREPAGHILLQQLRPLDISSTEIRHMIAAGRSPRYLVPDVVWQHIQDRALYGYRQNRQE